MDVEKCVSNKVESDPIQTEKTRHIEDQSINVKWKPKHKVRIVFLLSAHVIILLSHLSIYNGLNCPSIQLSPGFLSL